MKTNSKAQSRSSLWPALGFVGGGLLGLVDAVLFSSFNATLRLGGQDLNLAVVGGFSLTLALFGFALGRLAQARSQAHADRRTIAEQHQALVRSQQALVQQEKLAALGRLVASIAHQLRNPLGVIRSASGILRERAHQDPSQDPQLRRAAELVTEEVDHMNATITALLAFARPARLTLDQVALDQVLERAGQLTAERTPDGVALTHQPRPPLPNVVGDFNLLIQVVTTLLDNAVEAVEASGGQVVLRAAEKAGEVRIEVADDGPGITADETAQVFEPFYTTKPGGTGLGLALAHRIADAHGGSLRVVPNAGAGARSGGACLRLSLPIQETQLS